MTFPSPLERGTLVRRYKRFLADVVLDGDTVTAHVPNSGSMMGLTAPGAAVWLSRSGDPKRKLALTVEMIQPPGGPLVGVNTMRANRLAEAAIRDGLIPELAGYGRMRREVRYDHDSRIDLLLEHDDRPAAYVEVKSVTLSRVAGLAEFPDAVTARGTKHLAALERVVQAGGRAVMLFIAQRDDCGRFTTADDIDPAYGTALRCAETSGVEVLVRACSLSPAGIRVSTAMTRP